MKLKFAWISILFMLLHVNVWAQGLTIKGKVLDSFGQGMPGAFVLVKGTSSGTATGMDGSYSISVPNDQSTLVFNFLGYISQEVKVGNQREINITLQEDLQQMDEVIVVGYGSTKKADLTGSITTLKSDKISYQATPNVGQALQGKVSGMQVVNSGAPGSSPVIRIRGLASVRSNSEPLYVVDGVLTNDISFLGNNDIETLTVLKDASASAIYGVRAANGVILITTKRGNKEQTRVSFSGYFGVQKVTNMFEMANGQQYLELLNEKGKINWNRDTDPEKLPYVPFDLQKYPYSTNWYDEVLRDQAYTQSYDVSVSGGNEKTQYSFGGGFMDQEGMIKNNDYKRVNVRATLDMQALKWLKVGYSANLASTNTNTPPGVLQSAYTAPPCLPVRDENGKYTSMQQFGDFPNPAAQIEYYNDKDKSIRLLGSVYAEAEIIKDLKFKTSYGIDGSYLQNREYTPWHNVSAAQQDTTQTLTRQIDYVANSYWDNTLTYQKEFNDKHRITAMAGISSQSMQTLMLEGRRVGVEDLGDNTLYLRLGSDNGQYTTDDGSKITALSYFGRLNYSFMNKYLLTATLRQDGSSVFPENNRWDVFPSVGLGWVLTEEQFMKNQKAFDYLKFRLSWGELGNNNIPHNTAINYVHSGGYLSTMFGGTVAQGANITYFGPPNLMWEQTTEYDVAVEGFSFGNRLNYEVDLYYKKTNGAIFPVTVNSVLGAYNATYLDNNADLLNKGIELTLGWNDKIGDFKYHISGNYSFNDNEVVAMKEGTIGIYSGYMNVNSSNYTTVGHSIGEFYGRKVLGIFQNQAEINAYTKDGNKIQPNAQPGDFKYADLDGNGVINDYDRDFLGSPLPSYTYAINLGAEYKGVDLTIDLYGQGGNMIYNAKRFRQVGNENYDLDFYENRWHGEGTSYTYPSADMANQDNKVVNSWTIEKGDFFRIRNIQLGYTLPQSFTKKLGMNSIRVYANALNPWNHFKYKGFSPEISRIPNDETERENLATNQGIDSNVYPMSATYNFGINLNF